MAFRDGREKSSRAGTGVEAWWDRVPHLALARLLDKAVMRNDEQKDGKRSTALGMGSADPGALYSPLQGALLQHY